MDIFFTYRKKPLLSLFYTTSIWKINYRKELFPFQLKIALSWISGYFIFQLFNPMLFATEGPSIAGRMGMSLTALNGIFSLSMSWITTKIPLFSNYIAKNDFINLDLVFKKNHKRLLLICTILIFLSIILILKTYKIDFDVRFLSIPYLLALSVITLINQLIFSWATFLTCHKREPFLLNSIIGGILISFSTIYYWHSYGLNGIIFGYFIITIFFGLPYSYYIFKHNRIKYRSEYFIKSNKLEYE